MAEELSSPVAALLRRAADAPQGVALVADDEQWSNAYLAVRTERLARGLLRHGVQAGDRVAVQLHNTVDAVLGLLACWRIGATAVAVRAQLTGPEVHILVQQTQPTAYLADAAFGPLVADIPPDLLPVESRFVASGTSTAAGHEAWPALVAHPASQDDQTRTATPVDLDAPAILLPTTGTTGPYKLVIWTHRTLAALSLSAAGRSIGPGDVLALLTPLVHASGVYQVCTAMTQDATAMLVPQFEPGSVLDAMDRHGVTSMFGLPFMHAQLAREQAERPRRLSALRSATVAGDMCPAELEVEFGSAFGLPLRSFWAASEDVGVTTADEQVGPYMRVIPQATVQIVKADGRPVAPGETGELVTRSPTTTPGYWRADGSIAPLPDGAFRSGDLVREHRPGRLEYVGRTKDLIVRAGFNISPNEIETALRAHPDVVDAGVAGWPDPLLGERVGALVVATVGTDAERLRDAVLRWLRERLAPEKVPERLRLVPSIPRNTMGKIDRDAVRLALAED